MTISWENIISELNKVEPAVNTITTSIDHIVKTVEANKETIEIIKDQVTDTSSQTVGWLEAIWHSLSNLFKGGTWVK